jgi:hypothetical protein
MWVFSWAHFEMLSAFFCVRVACNPKPWLMQAPFPLFIDGNNHHEDLADREK